MQLFLRNLFQKHKQVCFLVTHKFYMFIVTHKSVWLCLHRKIPKCFEEFLKENVKEAFFLLVHIQIQIKLEKEGLLGKFMC